MDFKTWYRAQRTIHKTARISGVAPLQCRRDMQAAIDEAWANSRKNPEAKAAWDRYFPSGKKPTLEEFMVVLAGRLEI